MSAERAAPDQRAAPTPYRSRQRHVIDEVNRLLQARKQMAKMVRQMGKGKLPALPPELTKAPRR